MSVGAPEPGASATPLRDLFRTAFAHDRWATERLCEALAPLEGDPPEAQEAILKVAHVVAAHETWEARLRGTTFAGELFPGDAALAEVRKRFQAVSHRFAERIEETGEGAFLERIAYTSTSGSAHRSLVRDVLLHVTHHAAYHRGQAARLVRDHLGAPVAMDLVVFTRADERG